MSNVLPSKTIFGEGHLETTMTSAGRRAFLLNGRSSILVKFTLAMIYHTWKFSKAVRPSIGYAVPAVRKLSYSSVADTTRKRNDLGGKSRWANLRCYSSEGSSCKTTNSKSDCPDQKQEILQNQCPECPTTNSAAEESEKAAELCNTPAIDDPCCTPPPPECEKIEQRERRRFPSPIIDDCPPCGESFKERFWRNMVLYITFPVLFVSSVIILSNKRNRTRPEYANVSYMRRRNESLPWGDKHSIQNPVKNPISPNGYEVEDPNAAKTNE